MPSFYISEQTEIRLKLKTLSQIRVSEDGWTHYYRDESSKEEWILTRNNSESHGGGQLILKRQPSPSIDEVIAIVLTSKNRNDLVGAIFDLLDRDELEKEDFRLKLIQELKKYIANKTTSFDKERVKLIIQQCELLDIRNRREIVGKHYTAIEKDAEYFRTISKEAKEILNSIS
jgi:Immunity protein 27